MRDTRTSRELYLEDELERIRYRESEAREDEYRQRQIRRQEMEQRYEDSLRSADNWLDALHKQSILARREVHLFPGDGPPEDDFFSQIADACDEGIRIWPEEQARIAEEIARLQAQIDELNNSVRRSVGRKVAELHDTIGGRDVAAALLDPDADIESFLNW